VQQDDELAHIEDDLLCGAFEKGNIRSWRQKYDPELTATLVLSSWLTDFATVLQTHKKQRRRRKTETGILPTQIGTR
jgi:hypothetical protein